MPFLPAARLRGGGDVLLPPPQALARLAALPAHRRDLGAGKIFLARFVSLRVAGLPFGRFWVHLGDASYALYLTHLYIVGTTYFVVRTVLPATTLSVLAVAPFVILASVVAALLVPRAVRAASARLAGWCVCPER